MSTTGPTTGPVVAVVGNPQPASRTRTAAEAVATRLVELTSSEPGTEPGTDRAPLVTIDLAAHGPALLEWGSSDVAELKELVLGARALVVASPTYKAAYTGLCKLFLDQFDRDELAGLPTVAMMTGGNGTHALAVEVHLRPVLVEIGASVPARGLFLAGPEVDDPQPAIDAWWASAERPLRAAIT